MDDDQIKEINEDAIRKFVRLVLFQAHADHATELVISSATDDAAAIKYKVDGAWYEMAQPPAHILPDALVELRRLAGMSVGMNEGLIDLTDFSIRFKWRVTVESGGSRFLLTPHS